MEGEIAGIAESIWDRVEGISTTVWVALGLFTAAFFWILKWLATVLFVQGRGISLITVPFSRLAGKILEDKFAQKLTDTKVLPKLHVPRSWDEFNRFNGHVAHRMQVYRELIYLVQAKFNGPTAISLRIALRFFERNFVETFQTAEREFTEKQQEMARIQLKQLIAERPMNVWLRRRSGRFFSALLGWLGHRIWSVGEVRELRSQRRALTRKLSELRKDIAEQSHLIFSRHEADVVGISLELIEHDHMFLQHLYHRFWLEMESLTFTVASGRLMQMIGGDTEAGAQARKALGLTEMPGIREGEIANVETIRAAIRNDEDLRSFVGLGPEAVLEGSLEPYLRIKLLLKKITLPGYSAHWIAHLPPPSEFASAFMAKNCDPRRAGARQWPRHCG